MKVMLMSGTLVPHEYWEQARITKKQGHQADGMRWLARNCFFQLLEAGPNFVTSKD